MAAMELWNQKNKDLFFDPHRKKWVKSRPEELIRQAIFHKMVNELSYPLGLIGVERALHSLPHLSLVDRKKLPNRRLDIVVFAKGIHPEHVLFPLLIVECKFKSLTKEAMQQVIGYNDVLKAPFIAIANGESVYTGNYKENRFDFVEGLHYYNDLLAAICEK